MFLLPERSRAIVSASDLRLAAQCEWALMVDFDVTLGRRAAAPAPEDPMLARTAELGAAHEQAVLRDLHRDHPGRVVAFPRPRHTFTGYTEADAATRAALASDAEVVYQAAVFDDRFLGFADFLVRAEGPADPDRWEVWDSKLARTESVSALLQIAAYADQLRGRGVKLSDRAVLALGSGERKDFPLREIVPVYRARRSRLLAMLDDHQDSDGAARWGDERWHACGRCDVCVEQLRAHDDVLLVHGVRVTQRKKLNAAGVTTMNDLASRSEPVPDLAESTLARLREQARLQRTQDLDPMGTVTAAVHTPEALRTLPAPSAGDLFFDFEGDPLWREPGSPTWGLEYLFGVVEAPCSPDAMPVFRAFWAHDREQERQALLDFLAYVHQRRRDHPDMHVYHYAAYEKSKLLALAARYGVGENEVDDLLRDGILVDLYAVVRSAVRVSQDSYSIKKLEPLYMGADLRVGDVTTGGDSIVVYHQFSQARLEGRFDEAGALLESIRAYNEYDCLSTLRLRDWLLARARDAGIEVGPRVKDVLDAPAHDPHELAATSALLLGLLADVRATERTADDQVVAMVAGALLYNRREHKPFWWSHYDRLRNPIDEWVAAPDVFQVEECSVGRRGWFREGKQRISRRLLTLTGTYGRGSKLTSGTHEVFAIYDDPVPEGLAVDAHLLRAARSVTVRRVTELPDGRHEIEVEETAIKDAPLHAQRPVALAPKPPPQTARIDGAVTELAQTLRATWPNLPDQAAIDLLRRRPPRLRSGASLPTVGDGPDRFVDAVTTAVLQLDNSYLAVQGPPGTGKTYVGAHVVARLVHDHAWRVGVVSQSHAAVENVLDAVVKAGVAGSLVGKQAKQPTDATWTHLAKNDLASFAAERAATGYVIGGTAFDFCHTDRVARGQLDLLIIDEAGQYSLATTIACSVAAQRLLLLGDPQQLAQVSQGSHPEPVTRSALGWLIEDQPVLPSERGYFLETTWRLHPALAHKVSELSYAGALRSQESVTARRLLEGVDPGLHLVRVPHRDNAVESPEEAEAVAQHIEKLLGTPWTDPDEAGGPRPLAQRDIRVVTPYNVQVRRIRGVLDDRGLTDVAVGTVDRFQGQEGAVVFLSMAASARADVNRGVGFLLDRNRLNVSISRGKWAAYIVCSDVLTDFTPRSPQELLSLGAFLNLIET